MSSKLSSLQKRLDKYGVDAPTEQSLPERDLVLKIREEIEKETNADAKAKLYKKLRLAEKDYSLAFHHWFAMKYPDLLYERSEDKTFWLYNEDEGVYEEVKVAEARGLLLQELAQEGLKDYMTESVARNILARYRGIYAARGHLYEEFDADDAWFHANNGWLRLKDRKFEEHTPKRLSRRKSAVDYVKSATCPVYDKFLDEDIQAQKDEVRVLDQYSGLLLTHDIRHQKMLTIVGKPGSGKSTLLDTWSMILGDLVTQNALTDFSGDKYRFMGSSLTGRTLCWFDEVEVKRAEMSSVLEKKITAKKIEIERKGIDGTRYADNYLKFVLTANTLPLSAEQGIYRRLLIIPFDRSFTSDESVDRNMPDKLTEEAPGILNRMLKGLDDIQKMGTFTMISGHDEKIEEYKASSNTVAEFLETYFEPVYNDPQGTNHKRIPTKDLFEAYQMFMRSGRGFQLTPQRFGQMLKAQPLNRFSHIVTSRSKNSRYWTGLQLQEGCTWETREDGTAYIKSDVDEGDNEIRAEDVDF